MTDREATNEEAARLRAGGFYDNSGNGSGWTRPVGDAPYLDADIALDYLAAEETLRNRPVSPAEREREKRQHLVTLAAAVEAAGGGIAGKWVSPADVVDRAHQIYSALFGTDA